MAAEEWEWATDEKSLRPLLRAQSPEPHQSELMTRKWGLCPTQHPFITFQFAGRKQPLLPRSLSKSVACKLE